MDSITRREDIEKIAIQEEDRSLEPVEDIVRWLDDLIRIPILNIRIGLDPLIGLIPGFGDVVMAAVSFYLFKEALSRRIPKVVIFRMALNVAFDLLMGLLPGAGDIADVVIRSNRWNLSLIKKYAGTGRTAGFSDYLFIVTVIGLILAFKIAILVFAYKALSAAGKL